LRFKALNRKARSEQIAHCQTTRNAGATSSAAKATGKGAQKRADLLRSLPSKSNAAEVPVPKYPQNSQKRGHLKGQLAQRQLPSKEIVTFNIRRFETQNLL
jgi:hypothetical protein